MNTSIAQTFFMLGNYQRAGEAIAGAGDIFYLSPLTLAMTGREAEAIVALREKMRTNPDKQFRAYHLGLASMLEGDRETAARNANAIIDHNRDPEARYYMVRSLARIGESERALDVFELISRSFFPVYTFEHDPWLESIRSSPRFAEIMRGARDRHAQARAVWES
jgi:hypothetical protein